MQSSAVSSTPSIANDSVSTSISAARWASSLKSCVRLRCKTFPSPFSSDAALAEEDKGVVRPPF